MHHLVKFKSELSLNVAVAGSIIMYDRQAKLSFKVSKN